jgi:hypothetical protein
MKTAFSERDELPGKIVTVLLAAGLLLLLSGLMSAFASSKSGQGGAKTTTQRTLQGPAPSWLADPSKLPEKTAAMRDAILAAARTGSIEALRTPLEWNELKPEISGGPAPDPIAYWKQQSGDGEGRQILAVLLAILETPPAVVGAGTSTERYVWPGFAEADLATLPPPLEVQLYRLVSPAEAKTMRERKTWSWWRLTIGADGTWHSFLKAE